ncbi:MAG: S8 family serine peptidase [Deltaproteobacteria bacterium]|nr:S8 family serine peptidase [Deltaproteobacteria bacterium]
MRAIGSARRPRAISIALVVASVALTTQARADDAWRAWIADALAPRSLDGQWLRAWPSRPLLDDARAMVGAELAWERGGTRGAGATICVIDTGLDLAHRDFRDAEGHTRVRWLLDLDADPRGVHDALEVNGGAVWSREEIDDALARGEEIAPDWHGHGTSIASAAAGDDTPSDTGEDGLRAGIAPEAELVIVRALRRGALGFHDDDVVRGARFCVDPRVSIASRTVILLALGGHDGPHDGTSAYERALSSITARGAAVVVAAGNDGDVPMHAAGWLVREEPVALTVRLPTPSIDDGLVAIAVRGAREVRASVREGPFTPWASRGVSIEEPSIVIDTTDVTTTYVIAHGALAAGDLVIEARGAASEGGALDAWIVEARLGDALFVPRFVGLGAREGEEITIPATADGVIAVGASVSRALLEGESRPALTLEADESGRASFSSRGPRVDGAPLPTLLAPGGWIVAARSSSIDPADPEALFAGSSERFEAQRRGDDRLAVAGTSVAAALVAGAVALGRASEGGVVEDRVALSESASALALAEAPFDARTGAGLLQIPAYLVRRREVGAIAEPLELGCTRSTITPGARDLAVIVRSRGGGEARVRTRVVGEAWSGTRTMRGGWVAVPVAVPARVIGAVVDVEAEVAGRVSSACTVAVMQDATPLAVSGGCAVSMRPSARSSLSLAWLAIALTFALRRRARTQPGGVVLRSRP